MSPIAESGARGADFNIVHPFHARLIFVFALRLLRLFLCEFNNSIYDNLAVVCSDHGLGLQIGAGN